MFAIVDKENPNPSQCSIKLELVNNRDAFYAGEVIYGTIHVDLRSQMSGVDSIQLLLSGNEHIYFTHTTTKLVSGGARINGVGSKTKRITTVHENRERNQIIDLSFELAMTPEIG